MPRLLFVPQIENRMAVKRAFSSAIVYSARLAKGKVDLLVLFMIDNHLDLFKVKRDSHFIQHTLTYKAKYISDLFHTGKIKAAQGISQLSYLKRKLQQFIIMM